MNNYKEHIAKYLKGELSPSEMHDLEMKALHDPFLADALEGAEKIRPEQFAQDVDGINKKVKSSSGGKFFWPLRIAASTILMLSVIYFFIKPNPEKENLALNDVPKTLEESIPTSGDSTNEKEEFENLLSLNTEEKPTEPLRKRDAITKPRESLPQTVPNADEFKITEETDDNFVGEAEQQQAESIADLDIADEKAEVVKEEISMTRSEARREAAPLLQSGAGVAKAKKQVADGMTTGPTTSIGYEDYKMYLRNNIKYPKPALDNLIEGEVTVSFMVNENGILSDLQVEKGIGFGCDEELIRLIKEGPKWIPATSNNLPVSEKASVSFTFVLPK